MEKEIDKIIKSEDLKDLTSDLIEVIIDSNISDEVLKTFPITRNIISLKNIYNSVSDRIFLKKALHVLLELGEVNWKQRVELANSLKDKYSSGAEKILMAIDKLENIEKCKVFGRLCRLKALKKVETGDFFRLTKLIQDSYLSDLYMIKGINTHLGYSTQRIVEKIFQW